MDGVSVGVRHEVRWSDEGDYLQVFQVRAQEGSVFDAPIVRELDLEGLVWTKVLDLVDVLGPVLHLVPVISFDVVMWAEDREQVWFEDDARVRLDDVERVCPCQFAYASRPPR